MTTSRGTGQEGDPVSAVEPGALAPVIFLPGAREALAERESLAAAEAVADRQADARRAENVTMHALTRRGQSRAEVADLLRRREIDPSVAETELDRLQSVGLIDDRALAADLVDRLRSRKKLGSSALRNELMRRKLDRSAIDEALVENDDESSDDDLVVELARDRARRLGGLDRTTAERRLVDFLARKGHTGSTARDAARRALDGDSNGDDADDDADGDIDAGSSREGPADAASSDAAFRGGARIHRVEFR